MGNGMWEDMPTRYRYCHSLQRNTSFQLLLHTIRGRAKHGHAKLPGVVSVRDLQHVGPVGSNSTKSGVGSSTCQHPQGHSV